MSRNITIDVVVPHPPAEVWRALTDPTALADWLMPVEDSPRSSARSKHRCARAEGKYHCLLRRVGFSGFLLAFLPRNGWRRIVHKRLATHLTRQRHYSSSWATNRFGATTR